MPSLPRLLLALSPGAALPRLPVPVEPVHIGYRIGPDGRLLRAPSEDDWTGGFLMVSGAPAADRWDPDWLARQLISLCRAHRATGVVANWAPPAGQVTCSARLEQSLTRAGLELWLPESLANRTAHARVLISSHLSGGTLAGRLEEAAARWGSRAALAVECDPWLFPLPCPPGAERPLEEGELRRLLERRPRVWYSSSLCAQYITFSAEHHPCLALFDSGTSVRRKLELAERCGISDILLAWTELAPFVETVFPAAPQGQSEHRKTPARSRAGALNSN